MSELKLLPEPSNRFNTFLVHLFCIYSFCVLLQGSFLFTYPSLFVLWITLSALMTQFHYLASKYLRSKFFHESYMVTLWLFPLLYMIFGVLFFLLLLYLLEFLSLSGLIRQTLQLDLQSYSKSIYLYILLLVSSGTLFFARMTQESLPLLQAFHHNKKARKITRTSLIILCSFIILSLFYLANFAKNNVTFIRAYFQSVYSNDSYKPMKLYENIAKENRNRLYFNARLRMAKMAFRRFKNYQQSIDYLEELIVSDSPLKDEALLEKMRVLLNMSDPIQEMKQCIQKLRELKSCLLDEALFLYANALEGKNLMKEARIVYQELEKMTYTLTIISYINSHYLDYGFCSEIAKKKMDAIEFL
ncbi:hypothetical protein MJH12_13360 [bacterium]|nr:hypothetical protein [bacterium]